MCAGVKYSPLDLARHACALALAVVPLSILAYNHAQLRPVPVRATYACYRCCLSD